MNTLLRMKLLKMYVQDKTEVKETASDATRKVSCHCRKGFIYFQI